MAENPYLTAYVGEIGKIVFSVSVFEDLLTNLISDCFNLSEIQENALLRPLPTRAKIETLSRLGQMALDKPGQKALSKWCETTKERLEDRNALVHGQPGQEGRHVTFRVYSGKHGFFGKPEVWTMNDVCDVRDYFILACDEVEQTIRPKFEAWIVRMSEGAHSQDDASPAQPAE
ncbi:MAG: hypothetical protein ACLGHC_04605 [Alphaproteobacteria bacterium]